MGSGIVDLLVYFLDEMVTASWKKGLSGSYVNGTWTSSFDTPTDIKIVVPETLNQNQIQQLPQGERVQNFVQTWTGTDVNVRRGNIDSDRITYDGKDYLVYQVINRTSSGRFKHIILREITADE